MEPQNRNIIVIGCSTFFVQLLWQHVWFRFTFSEVPTSHSTTLTLEFVSGPPFHSVALSSLYKIAIFISSECLILLKYRRH